jgi:hypothetical protein
VLGEVDQARLDRRRVKQRRQEADQDDLGFECDPRNERQVRRRDADDDEEQGCRDPQPPGERGAGRDDGDEGHDLDRDMHAHSVAVLSRSSAPGSPTAQPESAQRGRGRPSCAQRDPSIT